MTTKDKTAGSFNYVTQYTCDKNNTLASTTYPTGRTIPYGLDQTGRVTQVGTTLNGNPKTLASSISYVPYGGITGLTYGNTLSLSQGYDNQYRVSSIVVGSILNKTYGYDPNGNIIFTDDGEPSGNEASENAGTYSYQQATNKLTQIQGELNAVYGYDANGNITSANNRTFVYDLSNRLIKVEDNSVTIGEYVYNGLNQRIKKTLPGETRIFHYDIMGHLIAETTTSGQSLVEYFYLGDQPLAMTRPTEALHYYHNDHLGTPQILTNDSGGVSWKAAYGPFGEAEISVGAVENNIRFPGQYYDQETGLHYNWNRYYDPKTGRYLASDPIGLRDGINLFVYVKNNPITFSDPKGLKFKVDNSCCDPKHPNQKEEIERDVERACAQVPLQITDLKLRKCILDRCANATVECRSKNSIGCWGNTEGYNWGFFGGTSAYICMKENVRYWGYYGCMAIHEWAETCGWEFGQGCGVPGVAEKGRPGEHVLDPLDCKKNWNSGDPVLWPRPRR